MYIPDFSSRSTREELLDDLSIEAEELQETLRDLQRVNAILGGYAPSLTGIHALLNLPQKTTHPISLLDVGTGCADIPRQITQWAKSQDLDIVIHAIDLSPTTITYAHQCSRHYSNITVTTQDLFELPDEPSYDIVHAALMLHHLPTDKAVEALQKMYRLSRCGIIINDLHRHPISYIGSLIILPLLSKNRLIRHDGPVSVLRAFTKKELVELVSQAGLPTPQITWHPLFRWQLTIGRETL